MYDMFHLSIATALTWSYKINLKKSYIEQQQKS